MNARQEWRNAVADSRLDATAKLVALILDRYMDGHGEAWPSKATLADAASVDPTTVKRAIHRLEAAGLVFAVRSKGRRSNRYRATMPNGGTAPPLEGSNGGTDAPQRGHSAPRTRSTEQEEQCARARETRSNAGAYRKADLNLPDVTADPAIVEQLHQMMRRWR